MNKKVLNRQTFVKALQVSGRLMTPIFVIGLSILCLVYAFTKDCDIELIFAGFVGIAIGIYKIKSLSRTKEAALKGIINVTQYTLKYVRRKTMAKSTYYELVFTNGTTYTSFSQAFMKYKPGEPFYVVEAYYNGGVANHAFSCNEYYLDREFQSTLKEAEEHQYYKIIQ